MVSGLASLGRVHAPPADLLHALATRLEQLDEGGGGGGGEGGAEAGRGGGGGPALGEAEWGELRRELVRLQGAAQRARAATAESGAV